MKRNLLISLIFYAFVVLAISCTEKRTAEGKELPLGTHFVVDNIHYETRGDSTVKATHPFTKEETQYSGDVTVPATVVYDSFSYKVVQIGEYAFSGCEELKSVTVAEGITEISPGAFADSPLLDKIVLPSSVESVGERAFDGTLWYGSQPDGMVYLGNILYGYKGVMPDNTEITVKDGTRVIAGNAFLEQKGLVSVKINEGVVSIGGSAFGWCENLVSAEIPNSVKTIFSSAFSTCPMLEKVVLPENLEVLDAMAFSCCNSIRSIEIPKKLKEIGLSSFAECHNLEKVTIPSNVKTIRSDAFWGCSSLTELKIDEGVEVIEKGAFMGCEKLKDISMPQSLTAMGDRVFENTAWLESQPEGLVRIGNIIYICKGTVQEEIKIDEGIKGIAGRAFYNCSTLKSVDLPSTLETIGEEAFFNCGLRSVAFPESLRDVGFMAFYGCNSLSKVFISSLEAWCRINFCGREANPLSQFGYLYLNGELLTDLVIPEGLAEVRSNSFVYGLCLQSVKIPGYVKRIGISAFEESRALDSLTIDNGVELISDNAFKNCMNLSKVTIPSSVRIVGFGAFEKCYKLSDLTISEGVVEISNMAFDGCSELEKVTIPSTVNRLGHRAFSNCMGLREVVCMNANPPEADDSFLFETEPEFVYGLVSLKVPKGSLEKYKNAKDWSRFGQIEEMDE